MPPVAGDDLAQPAAAQSANIALMAVLLAWLIAIGVRLGWV